MLTLCPLYVLWFLVTFTRTKSLVHQRHVLCTVLYCAIMYCTVLYYSVLYCTELYCTVLYEVYCTVICVSTLVLYCTVLCYPVLYCTILFHTQFSIEQYYTVHLVVKTPMTGCLSVSPSYPLSFRVQELLELCVIM